MITIKGVEIDFNITSPADILRLHEAQEKAAQREAQAKAPTDTNAPDYLIKYAGWLNELLNAFGNFIDDAFGDGVAEQLLTNNPSLDKIFDVNDELEKALGDHAKQITARFNKYKPNRATRRASK
ncbi:hypothetical protein LJC74_03105 [Eubacteriales bacterium OttesenSCG-928-A19]|nr:hypothetical protein [Eubacteriales bacterium OttesenSCG-928-A19]